MSKTIRQQLAIYCVVALISGTRITAHASMWTRALWAVFFFFVVPGAWLATERYLDKAR